MEWNSDMSAAPIGIDVLCSVTYNISADEWVTSMWVDFQTEPNGWEWYNQRIDIPLPPTHWMHLPKPPAE